MHRIFVLFTTVAIALAGLVSNADADCYTYQEWEGDRVRDIQAATAGDRVLIRYSGRALVVDRAGNELSSREAVEANIDHLIGGDESFFEIATTSAHVAVTRLDLDGQPSGEPIVLNEFSPDVMNVAQATFVNGVLAVTWTRPRAQYSSAFDIHIVLLHADGTSLAEHVVPGREGAYYAIPAGQGDVLWILWREDPYLQLKGVRYSTADGQPLDEEPIAIARDRNGFRVVLAGDRLRLYADSPSGEYDVYELTESGAVIAVGGFPGEIGTPVLGLPNGDVIHLDAPYADTDAFPASGTVSLTSESTTGALVSFFELASAEARVLYLDGNLVVIGAEDSADGERGESRLVVHTVSTSGQVLAKKVLATTTLELVDREVCDWDDDFTYYNGCAIGQRGSAASIPVLLLIAAVFAARRRSRS